MVPDRSCNRSRRLHNQPITEASRIIKRIAFDVEVAISDIQDVRLLAGKYVKFLLCKTAIAAGFSGRLPDPLLMHSFSSPMSFPDHMRFISKINVRAVLRHAVGTMWVGNFESLSFLAPRLAGESLLSPRFITQSRVCFDGKMRPYSTQLYSVYLPADRTCAIIFGAFTFVHVRLDGVAYVPNASVERIHLTWWDLQVPCSRAKFPREAGFPPLWFNDFLDRLQYSLMLCELDCRRRANDEDVSVETASNLIRKVKS